MHINRVALANILETKPSNIRKINQTKEKINVILWDSKNPVIIDVQEYKTHIGNLQKKYNSSGGSKKNIGILLMICGAVVAINGYTMNTTVSTNYGSVNNIGLINEQNKKLQLGGIAFIAGSIFFCLDKKDGD